MRSYMNLAVVALAVSGVCLVLSAPIDYSRYAHASTAPERNTNSWHNPPDNTLQFLSYEPPPRLQRNPLRLSVPQRSHFSSLGASSSRPQSLALADGTQPPIGTSSASVPSRGPNPSKPIGLRLPGIDPYPLFGILSQSPARGSTYASAQGPPGSGKAPPPLGEPKAAPTAPAAPGLNPNAQSFSPSAKLKSYNSKPLNANAPEFIHRPATKRTLEPKTPPVHRDLFDR